MTKQQTYQQLRAELDELLSWFDQEDLDIDEAVKKYEAAMAVTKKIETYLQDAQNKIVALTK